MTGPRPTPSELSAFRPVLAATLAAWLAATMITPRPLEAQVQAGIPGPIGIALDSSGAVYLANAGDSSVTSYLPGAFGAVAPVRRIHGPHTGLELPGGVALDSHGRTYVTNSPRFIEGEGSVTVYAPKAYGNAAPVRMLMGTHTRITRPIGLAVAPDGDIYVANGYGQGVLVFGPMTNGDAKPSRWVPPAGPQPATASSLALGDGELFLLTGDTITVREGTGPSERTLVPAAAADSNFAPVRLALGPSSELYVAHRPIFGGTASVSVYRPEASEAVRPLRTIAGTRTGLTSCNGLAVGRDGSIYVLGGDNRVAVYPARAQGDVAPVRVIAGPKTGLSNPTALALDSRGNLYVVNDRLVDGNLIGAAIITVYGQRAAGNVAPIRTIGGRATRLSRPAGVAVAEDGSVYVANMDVPSDDQGSVTVYRVNATGDVVPVRSLLGPGTRLLWPGGLVLDSADTLYVASWLFQPRVTVYAPGAGGEAAPVRSLEGLDTELERPHGLALDAAGVLFVADSRSASGLNAYGPDLGAVRVYRPGAHGNGAPLRTITGSATRLNGPMGVAVDRAGNTYVANEWGTGPGSVTVYGPDANGDARPLRIIAGPSTGLAAPAAVALDAADTLYVANAAGSVTVYEPRATGNAAPVRTIGRR
ncbi:MAG: NHL repeat-containing protein [Gemmatimonadales bacterium]